MSTTETTKKAARKPLPKPGKRRTYEQAVTSTMKRYAEALAKLAK